MKEKNSTLQAEEHHLEPPMVQQYHQQKDTREDKAKPDAFGPEQQKVCDEKPETVEEVTPKTEALASEPDKQQKMSKQPEGKEASRVPVPPVPVTHGLLPAGISLLCPPQKIMPPPLIPIPGGGGANAAKSDGNPLPASTTPVSTLLGG